MKASNEQYRVEQRGVALTQSKSVCPMGTSMYPSAAMLGLSSLCDEFGAIRTSELSVSPSEYSFGLTSQSSNGQSPCVNSSLLGSSLRSSVSRSLSDSVRQDNHSNLSQIGWHSAIEPSPFPFHQNEVWGGPFHPLQLSSKPHTEVFRSFSDNFRRDEDFSNNGIPVDSIQTFLESLKNAPCNFTDYDSMFKIYESKVIFALKLGYSESLLQCALRKLGLHAGENQILEELIRLQRSKHFFRTASPMGKPDERGSSFSIRSDSGVDISDQESDLLPIVIDGSNVAISHGNKERFSCKGIRLCVNWFVSRGHKEVTVFVPSWRKETPKLENPISDQHILAELQKEGYLAFTPSRQVSGRRYVCHDDRYILNLASETGAIVVSNDNYRELVNDKPEYKKVIEEKILMYTFVNDRFMPPDDPFGRGGPNLETFLRKQKPNHCQPCPYEKKCTYGNKCKYYHPDRGPQPQKSISEELKENSSKKINEVRARSPSDDHLGDPLIRTQSVQPSSTSDHRFGMKKALSRTKSLNPNLERSLLHQPHGSIWNHPLSMFENERQGPMAIQSHSQPPNKPLIDTSVLPPPLQMSWPSKRYDCTETGPNMHQKLERQLTLNPVSDPRIQMPPIIGDTIDVFSYPPPTLLTNFQQIHNSVQRKSSAPETASQRNNSRSPVSSNRVFCDFLESSQNRGLYHNKKHQRHKPHFPLGVMPGVIDSTTHQHQIQTDLKLCKSKSE